MMTRDEILAMEAGRELNALVATTILGWHQQEDTPSGYICPGGARDWISPDGVNWECNYCNQEDGFPDVSGSIAPAWEVVEYFGPAPFLLAFHPADAWRTGGGEIYCYSHWSCWFEGGGKIDADTAPEAICKAALLAVMEAA